MKNPNQDAIDGAYRKGAEVEKDEGSLSQMARDMANIIVPETLKPDEQKAFESGYEDSRRGKA